MINVFLNKYVVIICLIILPIISYSQCPEDPADLIINTQEEYDYFFETYPNCREYHIILINGEFAGDPQLLKYITTLILLIALIFTFLKFVIRKFDLQ